MGEARRMQELMEVKKARVNRNRGLFSSEARMSGGSVSRPVTEEEGAEEAVLYRDGS